MFFSNNNYCNATAITFPLNNALRQSDNFTYDIADGIHDFRCWTIQTNSELVFLNVSGAQESIPRNEFRQPM
jgi:hypothetical protein